MSKTRMKRAQVQVPWKAGLHLRPATTLVRIAQTFRSTIFLRCGGRLADARSVVSILLLAASVGSVVNIEVAGEDEANAAGAIARVFSMDDDGGDDGTAAR